MRKTVGWKWRRCPGPSMTDAAPRPLDPIGAHYLAALARRADQQQGRVKQLLDDTLAQLRAAPRAGDSPVDAGAALRRVPSSSPLRELTRELDACASQRAGAAPVPVAGLPCGELYATRYFRDTWSRLSTTKRVAQALVQAPKNAGPINAQHLVLQSLALMRTLSPDYLNRFTAYVDTLMALEATPSAQRKKPKRARNRD